MHFECTSLTKFHGHLKFESHFGLSRLFSVISQKTIVRFLFTFESFLPEARPISDNGEKLDLCWLIRLSCNRWLVVCALIVYLYRYHA